MSITSRCNGCNATSLNGVLQHNAGCPAAKPQIHHGSVMPSTTLKFDSPEEHQRFMDGLKISTTGMTSPTSPTSERERLARIFAKLAEDHIELSDPETAQAWQEDCAIATVSVEQLIADAQRSLLDKVEAAALNFGSWQQDKCDLHEKYTSACCGCQRNSAALYLLENYQDYIKSQAAQLRKEIG